jgi:hypothetical protein
MHTQNDTNARPVRRRLSLSFAGHQPKQAPVFPLSPTELRRVVAEMVG